MANNNSKLLEGLAYINLGLRLASEFMEEEVKISGVSTDEINARAETLHGQIKAALANDSAEDNAEIARTS
jgi:hypothetical protein